jgi:hypothetical protein
MELKINECNQKQITGPKIGLRHHGLMGRGLEKIYKEFEEASK